MKNLLRWKKVATIPALSLVLAACLQAKEPSKSKAVSSQQAPNSHPDTNAVSGGAPPLPGLRKRIAVGVFTGDSSGIADQLTTELVKSGRFIVVERAHLEGVNQERDLGTNNQTTAETAIQGGQLLGAQLLITGTVTESSETGQKALNVGVGGLGRVFNNMGANLSGTTAKVSLDVRLLDATTGQVMYSFRTQGKATGHGSSVQVEKNLMSLGGDLPQQTPLGEATRKAVQQAVAAIVQKMQDAPTSGQVTGQVVEIIDGQVYINCGVDSGIRAGDTLAVSAVVKQLVDPGTGLSLGNVERQIGQLRVQTVTEKYSIAQPVGAFQTKRGDLVRIKPRA